MALFDEEPKKPSDYELGQPLDGMSVGELEMMIGRLRAEIERLEDERGRKSRTMSEADAAFKPTMGEN